jgi:hypothetical protein
MASEWFYKVDGKKRGPVSSAQLQALAKSGELKSTDIVWKEGMAKWVSASTIKGLFSTGTASSTVGSIQTKSRKGNRHDDREPGDDEEKARPIAKSAQASRGMVALIGGSVALFAIFGVCGFCVVSNMMARSRTDKESADLAQKFKQELEQAEQQSKEDIAEASRLWESGNKRGAVTKYKSAIERGAMSIPSGERPTAFQRVVEYEYGQGNTSSAKGFIEKAVDNGVPFSFNDPKLQEFAANSEKTYRETRANQLAQLDKLAKKAKDEGKTAQPATPDGKPTVKEFIAQLSSQYESRMIGSENLDRLVSEAKLSKALRKPDRTSSYKAFGPGHFFTYDLFTWDCRDGDVTAHLSRHQIGDEKMLRVEVVDYTSLTLAKAAVASKITKKKFVDVFIEKDTTFRASRNDVIRGNFVPKSLLDEAFGEPYKMVTKIEGTGIKRKDRKTWVWKCQDGPTQLQFEFIQLPNDAQVAPDHRGKVMILWTELPTDY